MEEERKQLLERINILMRDQTDKRSKKSTTFIYESGVFFVAHSMSTPTSNVAHIRACRYRGVAYRATGEIQGRCSAGLLNPVRKFKHKTKPLGVLRRVDNGVGARHGIDCTKYTGTERGGVPGDEAVPRRLERLHISRRELDVELVTALIELKKRAFGDAPVKLAATGARRWWRKVD